MPDQYPGASYHRILIIKRLPNAQNASSAQNWRPRAKAVRDWKQLVWGALLEGPRPPRVFPVIMLNLTRVSSAPPDYDNLVASFKPLVDALRGQVVTDDTIRNFVGGRPWYYWDHARTDADQCVKLEIWGTGHTEPLRAWWKEQANGEATRKVESWEHAEDWE